VLKTAGPILWSEKINVECAVYIKKEEGNNKRLSQMIDSSPHDLNILSPSGSIDEEIQGKLPPLSEKHETVKRFVNRFPQNEI
jgi:hypothetical protein